jgi:hypothetical protein
VNETKTVAKNLAVIWLSLKAHQLCVDVIEASGGLGQNHATTYPWTPHADDGFGGLKSLASTTPLKGRGSLLSKRLISVAE